jgi:hypothetical protein
MKVESAGLTWLLSVPADKFRKQRGFQRVSVEVVIVGCHESYFGLCSSSKISSLYDAQIDLNKFLQKRCSVEQWYMTQNTTHISLR